MKNFSEKTNLEQKNLNEELTTEKKEKDKYIKKYVKISKDLNQNRSKLKEALNALNNDNTSTQI